MSPPWWERFPGRLEFELAELEALGIRHRVDEDTLERHGIVRIELWPEIEGLERPLVALYPDLYPYFRFEVFAPKENLARHQDPFRKNLCLLDRPAGAWHPDDTLGRVLVTQLPKVFAAQGHQDGGAFETNQAEPVSATYPYAPESGLLVDSAWALPDGGSFAARISAVRPDGFLRGAVIAVFDRNDNLVAEAEPRVAEIHRSFPELRGRWTRTPVIHSDNPAGIRRRLGKIDRALRREESQTLGDAVWVEVVAGVYPEEANTPEGRVDAWLFVARTATGSRQERRAGSNTTTTLIPGMRAGRGDLGARVPELAPLGDKTVVVVGLGGAGAPSAIELAKAGVGKIVLIDGDTIDAGTAPRYPLGFSAAGLWKAATLAKFITVNWPHTDVAYAIGKLGAVREPRRKANSQADDFLRLIEGANFIYDASGDPGVSFFLTDVARELGAPHIVVSTTVGAWGGRVARFLPDRGPCFSCLSHAIADEPEDISAEESLVPAADPNGDIQPTGCADVTFTGTGFDVGQVALAGVRLAASTLCEDHPGAYPSADWNVAIMNYREPDGTPTPGESRLVNLAIHERCERSHAEGADATGVPAGDDRMAS